jgi:hypothetical protein
VASATTTDPDANGCVSSPFAHRGPVSDRLGRIEDPVSPSWTPLSTSASVAPRRGETTERCRARPWLDHERGPAFAVAKQRARRHLQRVLGTKDDYVGVDAEAVAERLPLPRRGVRSMTMFVRCSSTPSAASFV